MLYESKEVICLVEEYGSIVHFYLQLEEALERKKAPLSQNDTIQIENLTRMTRDAINNFKCDAPGEILRHFSLSTEEGACERASKLLEEKVKKK